MYRLLLFITIHCVFINCRAKPIDPQNLSNCDLIFQIGNESYFSEAITSSTLREDSVSFVHVGIIECKDDGEIIIIEADPQEGVKETSLTEFMSNSKNGVVVKRLKIEFPAEIIIERAKRHLGEEYDWIYLPDNGKMYCSELVYDAFVDMYGNPIFKPKPMNFLDPEGKMPEFWTELFKRLNMEVPQGIEGSNPNDLARDERLVPIKL